MAVSIFQTPQFQIVECACHDDATQAQHRVGALSPMPSCLGIGGAHWWVGMDTHGTPVPTQWEGRAWLDGTHEHMAPEHATDTNEPRRDARSYKLGFGDPCALLTERAMVTQLMTRLLTGDSMSDLQLWSQLVTKCQNTDLTIMVLPTFPRNMDTANEKLSIVTEYFTKLNDMCAVETEFDDTRHPEH